MTSRDFCFWLQGYFELAGIHGQFSHEQIELIRRHLALVFKHEIDPSAGNADHQAELNKIHAPNAWGNVPNHFESDGGGDGLIRC